MKSLRPYSANNQIEVKIEMTELLLELLLEKTDSNEEAVYKSHSSNEKQETGLTEYKKDVGKLRQEHYGKPRSLTGEACLLNRYLITSVWRDRQGEEIGSSFIYIWDIIKKELITIFPEPRWQYMGHLEDQRYVYFLKDCTTVSIWDITFPYKPIKEFYYTKPSVSYHCSPLDMAIFKNQNNVIAFDYFGVSGHNLIISNIENPHKAITEFKLPNKFFLSELLLFPDEKTFIGGIVYGDDQTKVCLWDINDPEKPIKYFNYPLKRDYPFQHHNSFSGPDRFKYLKERNQLIGWYNEKMYLWDVEKGGDPMVIFRAPHESVCKDVLMSKNTYDSIEDILPLPGGEYFIAHYRHGVGLWKIPSDLNSSTKYCNEDTDCKATMLFEHKYTDCDGLVFLSNDGNVFFVLEGIPYHLMQITQDKLYIYNAEFDHSWLGSIKNKISQFAIGIDQKTISHTLQLLSPEEKSTALVSYQENKMNFTYDFGAWDSFPTQDPFTHQPIFTYRIFKDNREIGSADFYGQPMLCVSEDRQSHNLLKTTGVLQEFSILKTMSIEEVCKVLPPTLFDKILISAKNSAVHGTLRGMSNIIGYTLHSKGMSQKTASYLSHLAYYSSIFAVRFASYYQEIQEYETFSSYMNALCKAAYETGQLWFTNVALKMVSSFLKKSGEVLENRNWTRLGKGLKQCSSLLQFGIFVKDAIENDAKLAVVNVAAGTLAQNTIEWIGGYKG